MFICESGITRNYFILHCKLDKSRVSYIKCNICNSSSSFNFWQLLQKMNLLLFPVYLSKLIAIFIFVNIYLSVILMASTILLYSHKCIYSVCVYIIFICYIIFYQQFDTFFFRFFVKKMPTLICSTALYNMIY